MTLQTLFTKPSRWCQGSYARNKDGLSVAANCPDAESWCLGGAIIRCYSDTLAQPKIIRRVIHYLERHGAETQGGEAVSMAKWNDRGRTFDDILQLVQELDI
jgi:hypothetical protein